MNKRYRIANGCEKLFSCEDKFTKYLNYGDEGDEVKKVQRFLTDLGFYNSEIDGIYGPLTTQAVKDFQNEN